MNKVHRTIWNNALNAWVAVAEIAKASGKTKTTRTVLAAPLLTALGLSGALAAPPNPPAANALPTGGVVSAGTASLGQAGTAASPVLNINQSSQRAAINWGSFNIGQAATVNFNQPNAQSVTLNRVLDATPSQVFGKINAPGQVYLVNPSGVYFGPSASVDVGGLVATTHSMSDAAFMAGGNTFLRNGAAGRVENEGELKARLDGYIALLAPEVVNNGVIVAERGTAVLANGESITLDFNADHKLSGIVVTASDIASLIENKHAIETPDGQIIMSAQSVSALRGSLIKNSGSLIANTGANSITRKGGRILLEGDDITLSSTSKIEAKGEQGGGTVLVGGDWQGSNGMYQATKTTMEAGAIIDASATQNGDGGKVVLWSDIHNPDGLTQVSGSIIASGMAEGSGGQIETSGHQLGSNGSVTAGRGGLWLLDPTSVNITNFSGTGTLSGDLAAAGTANVNYTDLAAALSAGTNVSVTSSGAITVGNAATNTITVSYASALQSTLTLDNSSGTNQPITFYGLYYGGISQSGTGVLNLVVKSKGGVITLPSTGSTNPLISINGNISIDNTNGGTVTTATAAAGGVVLNGTMTSNQGNIDIKGVSSSTNAGVSISQSISALASDATATPNKGLISISGKSDSGSGVQFTTTNGGATPSGNNVNFSAKNIITGNKITIDGQMTTNSASSQSAVDLGYYAYSIPQNTITTALYSTGGDAFAVNGTVGLTSNLGIGPYSGTKIIYIKIASNGGDVSFKSNGLITLDNGSRRSVVEFLGDATYQKSTLTIDTTSGDLASAVMTPTQILTGTATNTRKLDFSVLTNGAPIEYRTVNGINANASATPRWGITAGSYTGNLTLDNTCLTCVVRLTPDSNTSAVTSANSIKVSNSAVINISGKFTANALSSSVSTEAFYVVDSGVNFTVGSADFRSAVLNSAITANNGITSGGGNFYLALPTFVINGSDDSIFAAGWNRPAGDIYGGAFTGALAGVTIDNSASTGKIRVYTGSATLNTTNDYGVSSNSISFTATSGNGNWLRIWSGRLTSGTSGSYTPTLQQNFIYGASFDKLGTYTPTLTSTNNIAKNAIIYNRFVPSTTVGMSADISDTKVYATSTDAAILTAAKAALTGTVTLGSNLWWGLNPSAQDNTTSEANYKSAIIDLLNLSLPGVSNSSSGYRPVGTYNFQFGTVPITNITTNWVGTQDTLTITKKDLSISGLTVNNKTYDGTTTATLNMGSLAYTGLVSGDVVNVNITGADFASANVGTHGISLVSSNTGADQGNYNIIAPAGLQGTINAKALTITGQSAASKAYDGTNAVTLSGGTLNTSDVISADVGNVTLATQSGTFAQVNVGTGISVTGTSTLGGTAAGNYTLTQPTGLSANITAKALTITGQTVANKVYDSTNTATLSGGTLVGVIGSENVTLTQAGTFAQVNVGTGISITGASTLGGTAAGNYSLTQPTGLTANITAKALTITGQTAANKTYDGNNTATLSGGSLVGVIGSENVTLTQAGTFAQVNVGTGISITAGNSLGGTAAVNYSLTQPTGLSANITAKALTITGQTAVNKTYDGNDTATISGGTLVGVVGGESVTLNQSGTGSFASLLVGTGIGVTAYNTLGGAPSVLANYTLTQPTLSADITAKVLTVSGLAVSNKVYDGNANATVSNWGAVDTGISGETLVLNHGSASFNNKNAGTAKTVTATGYSLSDGTGLASNYVLSSTSATTSANITTKALTISGQTAVSRAYDGTDTAGLTGGSLVGVVAGDVVTLNQSGGGSFATFMAGNNIAVTPFNGIAGADQANYSLTQPTGLSANITPKVVTVSGLTASNKAYDGTTAATVSGATVVTGISGESLTLNGGAATFANASAGTGKTVTATGYTLSDGTGAAVNYVLSSTSSTTTADITRKVLTVSGLTASNKTYDGTTAATVSGATVVTGISGESLTLNGGAATFANANAGVGKTVTATGYTLADGTGGLASNYTLSSTSSTATATIDPKTLTVSGFAVSDKTYDGTNAVTVSSWGTVATGISGEALTLNHGTAGLSDFNAGTGKTVTATGYSLANGTGGLASNYVLSSTSSTATMDIAQKQVTVSGLAMNNRTYDGTADVSASVSSWGTVATGVAGEALVLTPGTASLADANAGLGKTVTASGYALANGTGGLASNYVLTSTSSTTTMDIARKAVTVLGQTVSSRAYTGTNAAPVSGGTLDGVISGDNLLLNQSATFASVNVGTGIAVTATNTLGGTSVGNYLIAMQPTLPNADITPATLTVTASNASKVYGSAKTFVGTEFTSSGLQNGESIGSVSLSSTGAASTVGVGSYPIVASAATGGTFTASNYTIGYTNGALSVTPKALTVNGLTVSGKTYDGTTTAAINTSAVSLAGLVGSDQVTVTVTGANFVSANAGTHTVSLTSTNGGADVGNYTITAPNSLTGTISQAPLTVTADTKSMTYGGNALPGLTYTSSGFVNNETAALFSGALATTATAYNGIAGSGSNAGTYPINAGTLSAGGNYAIAYTGANLTVNKAQLTVTGNSPSMTYGANSLPTLSTAYSGYVNGDTSATGLVGAPTVSTLATAYNGTARSASDVGTYAVTAGVTGMSSTNYTFTPVAGTLTVNRAPITVGGLTVSGKTYDGTATAVIDTTGATYAGLIAGDTVSVSVTGANFASANAGTHAVNLTSTATGAQAGNYSVNAPGSLTGTISPKVLTATGTKAYDGAAVFTSAQLSLIGAVAGETVAATAGTATASSPNVGAYNGTALTGLAIGVTGGGALASNYSLPTTVDINITPAPIIVTPLSVALSGTVGKVYDGTTAARLTAGNYAISGFASNEGASITQATGTYDTANAGTGKLVTVNLSSGDYSANSGTSLSNYLLQTGMVTGRIGTITPAPLTVTADAKSMTYGGTALPSLTYTQSGLVNGETASVISGALTTTATAYNGTAGSASNAGAYPIARGSLSAGGNYAIVYTGANLTVTPAPLTIQANDQSKTYDGMGHTVGVTYSGFVAGQNASALTGTLTNAGVSNYDGVSVYGGDVSPGSYDVTPAGLTSSNYEISYTTGLLTIDPAPLTVTAKSFTKVQNNVPYRGGNGVTYAGFVNGEGVSALSGTLAYSGTSQNATRAGTFNIVPGGLSSVNYVLSYVNGTLTITPKPVVDNVASTLTTSTATTVQQKTTTTAVTAAAAASTPVITTVTGTAAALDLGGFKVVGATQAGQLDVVFVPNPAQPQITVPVVQLPLTTGQGAVPDTVVGQLYLTAGLVAPVSSGTASAASGTTAPTGASAASGSTATTDATPGADTATAAGTTAATGGTTTTGTAAASTATVAGATATTGGATATGTTATAGTAAASGGSTTAGATTAASTATVTGTSSATGATAATGTTAAASADSTSTASGSTARNNVRVEQTQITTVLANDAPLPTQLTFNPENKTFALAKGADLKLPLQVKIQLRQGGSVVSEKLVMLTNEF